MQPTPNASQRPVVVFNASTRLQAMSQNAAYSYLTALSLMYQGIPVIHFACRAGMSRCVLGSNRDNYQQSPPCKRCIHQSKVVYQNLETTWFDYYPDDRILHQIAGLSVHDMETFEFEGKPLGFWAVNSLRWMLRLHHLQDDEPTRQFFREFILSGWNIYEQFHNLIRKRNPTTVILFNGMFYPEAAARYACQELGIRVITHEVGLRPFTAFFTPGEATAYPMDIADDFHLSPEQNRQLDAYLGKRFKGDFSMAGIRFWPEMNGLDSEFLEKIRKFSKIIPVFTNVIFDTSQVHANTIFKHMFEWLDNVHEIAQEHPDILFVIRAHPDESRAGKASRESVAQWVKKTGIQTLPNVLFVDSTEYISSYELIQMSHLVMVYNSTIGLEATLMGKPVLAGGKARFTQLPTSFYPADKIEYRNLLADFLSRDSVSTPEEFITNARRFLYYQLFATSLDFSQFIEEDGIWQGYVKPKFFNIQELTPERNQTIRVLHDGILNEGNFCYPV